MVVFEQLRISDDGKTMYIDAHVHEWELQNCEGEKKSTHITRVAVATSDKVNESSVNYISNEECKQKEMYVYYEEFSEEEHVTELHLVLNAYCLENMGNSFSNDLFFVFIEDSGDEDPCVPCPISSNLTVGVTFDENLHYQQVMDYTKALADDCQIPQGFVDYILRWNALKASIETEHWCAAQKFYKMLFGGPHWRSPGQYKRGGCGCHG